jgi:predicted Fe-Mo cluster-binding NifX family protein
MKICMPTAGNSGLKEAVFAHFGSAGFFTIYDTETKSIEIVKNSNSHDSHGGCQPLGSIAELGVDVILTSGMGRRAVQILNDGGIKVFLLSGNTVEEAVSKFERNELAELSLEGACSGHGCH